LQSLGIELIEADLGDPESLRGALAGADVVYHCAAKVGEWGPWETFDREIIQASRNVAMACRDAGVPRLIHTSTIAVYGRRGPNAPAIDETAPLVSRFGLWEYYRRAKVETERIVGEVFPEVTILRPSWLYGPRDRSALPRLLRELKRRRVMMAGRGQNKVNLLYAGDAGRAAILAGENPVAMGRAYNVSSPGEITQRELLDALCAELGRPPVKVRIPLRLSYRGALVIEAIGRLIRKPTPPRATRYAADVMTRATSYSIARAKADLGWEPTTPFRTGLQLALAEMRSSGRFPA
jgi:nucleoside-diphosphate-sugar epimerase